MVKASYEQIIEKIARTSGLSKEDVARRIDAKIAKLSNLISKEGAAQVVAAELGVSFDKQKVKINELLVGMHKISVVGKIIRIFPVRSFKTKNAESKVVSFILADETENVRVVLWDTNHIALVENGTLHEGSIVEIKNASIRGDDVKEMHIGSFSELKESSEKIGEVVSKESMISKNILQLHENDRARIKATIVQAFEPKFFFVCPECNSKVLQENGQYACQKHGIVMPLERAIITLIVDDGSDNIRTVCFSEAIKKLFNCDGEKLKDATFFLEKKNELLGLEFLFAGRARHNKIFDSPEFLVQDLESVDVDEVIKELSNAHIIS